MLKGLCVAFILLLTSLFGVPFEQFNFSTHPQLHEDMDIHVLRGNEEDAEVLICCHGFGGCGKLTQELEKVGIIPHHIVGFNFPSHGSKVHQEDPHKLVFGTVEELLPLFHVMLESWKAGADEIHVYGFSAGGGAVVNAMGVLAKNRFPRELKSIGIGNKERKALLKAVERGSIILDCPLKSIDELVEDRGLTPELEIVGSRFVKNRMVPIEALRNLQGLKLNILLHFQEPDLTLTNRDDALYISTLRQANRKGKTHVVIGDEGAHECFLPSLQSAFQAFHR